MKYKYKVFSYLVEKQPNRMFVSHIQSQVTSQKAQWNNNNVLDCQILTTSSSECKLAECVFLKHANIQEFW